ncbi:SCN4B [Cervus elaphus hippelaphus]|uniref:SCN4B n=1 Tax=Cervus elaphus hippelaphus TaxID=46360 RepID=A0A212DIK1_CEREH|nr:SCN4B [Cervus elaphus hippelaphus]
MNHGGLFLLPVSLSLEVSVGKATTIYAVNGTEILLPCTFSSCFGFENLHFWWSYNSSDTYKIVMEEVDNTVTLIILGVVGGVIGLLIFILLVKKFIAFIIKKTQEKKKECLVSSSGNDNTENGLPGSKAEEKAPTKV